MQYNIQGGSLPYVECILNAAEQMICEAGAMSWMQGDFSLQTKGGGLGKMFGRMFSGEHMFQNIYTCHSSTGLLAFTSSFPGCIMPFTLSPGETIILQKSAFLACEAGVTLEAHINKSLGKGLFGGEGFIMQRVSGQGILFAEFDGNLIEKNLAPGEHIQLSSGFLAAMDSTCQMDIIKIEGVKNMLFGGEGIFNTLITGPGRVWIQTMPMPKIASGLQPYLLTDK